MRLLEKYSVEQTFYDGAQLNNFITSDSSGRVFGLICSYTSRQILISSGLMIVKGYRISFENEALITFDATPDQPEVKSLILRIAVTQENSSAEIVTGSVSNVDDIEKGPGVFDYLLLTFVIDQTGIKEIIPQIKDIKRSVGSGIGTGITHRNLTETELVNLMGTLSDDVYLVNTLQYGDEFLFVQKKGTQIARYTGLGASYTWNTDNQSWVGVYTGSGNSSRWHSGTMIDGIDDNINCYDLNLYKIVNVGDLYRNNNTQNTYTCTFKDLVKTVWRYESNIRGANGLSVHIRYSRYADGTGFTASWTEAQSFIGVAVSDTAPLTKADYIWSKFSGLPECSIDFTTTSITHIASIETDKTFSAVDITSIIISIPSEVSHGYYAGVNFKTSASSIPTVAFTTQSPLPVKLSVSGRSVDSYTPKLDKMVNILLYCDGVYIYAYVSEV
jgi:hypothetical protein